MSARKGIYHWKLGDVALARICKKVYANVRVLKNEKGLFYGDKVLGISGNTDGSITVTKEMCYYVETCKTKNKFWLPYTSMHLAERSRPFYGPADKAPKVSPPKPTAVTRKRKLKEDLTVPLNVKLSKLSKPCLNTTYDIRHTPLKKAPYENAFKEFIRRGKEMLFDQYFVFLQKDVISNRDALDYLMNVDASTEDKFEMVIRSIVTEKEIENYLRHCWRYNFVHKQTSGAHNNECASDSSNSTSPQKPVVTIHAPWCLVCGKGERLYECTDCPSSFHMTCRGDWLVSILHRKNPPKKETNSVTFVDKILSGTRTVCTVKREKENTELCPSCTWGPRIGYDDVVWHKLGQCHWWPARVLTPGSTPSCLLARNHSPHDWPLRYYGTLNHSWGDLSRMCLFMPAHATCLPKDEAVAEAVLDACDDYISVYLT